MSTVRRSARIAAKANKQTSAQPPAVNQADFASQTDFATQPYACGFCKKDMVVRTIKNYVDSTEYAANNFAKVGIAGKLFEFIDKHFEFINTEEFDTTKRFVRTIHNKTIELERDLKEQMETRCRPPNTEYYWKHEHHVYNNALELVQRVHTKCHFYGIDKLVLADLTCVD